ncbi:MAG: TIGR04255 family protein [Leptospiraceae bacterium]|nr:TIGR04255 family protein [Leptospiraceae bacterium]
MEKIKNLDGICYEKNFLTDVIFRIDFSPILSLQSSLNKEFINSIEERFKRIEQQQTIEIQATVGTDSKLIGNEFNFFIWKVYDINSDNYVSLSHKHLSIVTNRYTNFDAFYENINFILKNFRKFYGNDLNINRIGMRYINKILMNSDNQFGWNKYLHDSLTQFIDNFIGNKNALTRSLTQMHYKLNDDDNMIFTYGIYNSDFPSVISKKEFILDYDCFTRFAENRDELKIIIDFHKQVQLFFEQSITEDLRLIMKEITQNES